MPALGIYSLCNSDAAQQAVSEVGTATANTVDLVGKGLCIMLVALALAAVICGIGWGLSKGAKPTGEAIAVQELAKAAAAALPYGGTLKLPSGMELTIKPAGELRAGEQGQSQALTTKDTTSAIWGW